MHFNPIALLLASIVPILIGAIWYNPILGFGTAWMHAAGVMADGPRHKMAVVFGVTWVFSMLLALGLLPIVAHQYGVASLLTVQPDFKTAGSVSSELFNRIMELYGNDYRTFKHGALHGTITGVLLATPVFTINALFETKGFKYIAINCGYWILCCCLMGAIMCGMN